MKSYRDGEAEARSGIISVGKIAKKTSLVFINSALKIQCHVAKNAQYTKNTQTAFRGFSHWD